MSREPFVSFEHEIGRVGLEGHVPSVGADRRVLVHPVQRQIAAAREPGARIGIRLVEDAIHVGVAIVHEELPRRSVRPHVRRHRDVGDEAAARADRWLEAVAVRLRPARPQADAHGGAVDAVMDKEIVPAVRVAGHEIRRGRLKDDPPAIRRDGAGPALAVGLRAGRRHADAPDRARLPILQEHVLQVVRVARHEIGGVGCEDREPAITTQRLARSRLTDVIAMRTVRAAIHRGRVLIPRRRGRAPRAAAAPPPDRRCWRSMPREGKREEKTDVQRAAVQTSRWWS